MSTDADGVRRCNHHGCETRLSRYNRTDYCSVHERTDGLPRLLTLDWTGGANRAADEARERRAADRIERARLAAIEQQQQVAS